MKISDLEKLLGLVPRKNSGKAPEEKLIGTVGGDLLERFVDAGKLIDKHNEKLKEMAMDFDLLRAKSNALWAEIKIDLKTSARHLRINDVTGEVFEIIHKDDDGDADGKDTPDTGYDGPCNYCDGCSDPSECK